MCTLNKPEPCRIRKTHIVVFLLLLIVSGCVSPASKIKEPMPYITDQQSTFSIFRDDIAGPRSASMGEELFWVFNYRYLGSVLIKNYSCPTSEKYPQGFVWSGTHRIGSDLVYTCEKYYLGQIGITLDNSGIPIGKRPLIQVSGNKKGRSWKIQGEGKFFIPAIAYDGSWGVRYGGTLDGVYVFEICKSTESAVIEILQSLKVSEEAFLDGIIIRGVLLKGLAPDKNGVIRFDLHGEQSPPPNDLPKFKVDETGKLHFT